MFLAALSLAPIAVSASSPPFVTFAHNAPPVSAQATVGLGLELPSPTLAGLSRCPPLAGLGIYIDPADLEEWEGMTPSPSPEQSYPSPVPTSVPALAFGDASVGLGIDVPGLKTEVLSLAGRED